MRYTWKNTGVQAIDDMGRQLEQIIRPMNENHIQTRYRYIEAMERYIKFIVPTFKQSKLGNMQDKHIEAYARNMKEAGKTDRYIKTDLSALRYFHAHMAAMGICRTQIKESAKQNQEIGLCSTPPGRSDRSWSEQEKTKACEMAMDAGKPHIATAIHAMFSTGMRLNECVSLRRSAIESALSTGRLPLRNTKGGRPREIPISNRTRDFFSAAIENVERGAYVFVPPDTKVHEFKAEITEFLAAKREQYQDPGRSRSAHTYSESQRPGASAHGLRHTFAQNRYREYREEGMTDREARLTLAQELGHNRIEVTYIYVPNGG